MWMLSLYLHVNQKSDDNDDDSKVLSASNILKTSRNKSHPLVLDSLTGK